MEKHTFHVSRLEALMRMVDNDAVHAEQIWRIKDDVEYYVDSNQDVDFAENDFVYEDLALDEIGAACKYYFVVFYFNLSTSFVHDILDVEIGEPYHFCAGQLYLKLS